MTSTFPSRALLPQGLYDLLPPEAEFAAALEARALEVFARYGFLHVSPPLVEIEESLLSGRGESLSAVSFRVMDPLAQKMLAIRADLTLQVARIAATRLADAPRPLRLAYAGEVLRQKPASLRGERQFTQAGIELIGASSPLADAEVIIVTAEALKMLGITDLSVDLNLPRLVPLVLKHAALNDEMRARLLAGISLKDPQALGALPEAQRQLLVQLMELAGPAKEMIVKLKALKLPAEIAPTIAALEEVVKTLSRSCPELRLTFDAVENRDLEYHTGISFSFFAKGFAEEVGRGGRYLTENGEDATGATLYVSTIFRGLEAPAAKAKAYVPFGVPLTVFHELQQQGYVTVNGLEEKSDAALAEAKRLKCRFIYDVSTKKAKEIP